MARVLRGRKSGGVSRKELVGTGGEDLERFAAMNGTATFFIIAIGGFPGGHCKALDR
jgi:hypothetical protein